MKRVGQLFREELSTQLKDGIENNSNVFILSYSNLSAMTINNLRMNLRKAGAKMHVSKSRIAKLVLTDMDHKPLADNISNQTALIWGNSDSVEVSKVLVDFVKDCETAKVTGGLLDGRVLQDSDVKRLSDLPSKQVLQSMLLSVIQAPVTRLLGAMNAKSRDLLSILKQLSEQKEGK